MTFSTEPLDARLERGLPGATVTLSMAWSYPVPPNTGAFRQGQDGEVVFLGLPHASEFVVPAEACRPIASGLDAKDLTWTALAQVAFVAARNAAYQMEDTALVVGAGPVGQLSVRWARADGVTNIVEIDQMQRRLALAKRGGAKITLAGSVTNVAEITQAFGGAPPRVVIDATGHAGVFAGALAVTAFRGRLVPVGDTGFPSDQHLSADLLPRGLTVIGTHVMHLPHVLGITDQDPFTSEHFVSDMATASRRFDKIFQVLVADGRFDLGGLISHEFGPAQCVDAYHLAEARRDETMGLLFDWSIHG